MRVDCQILGGTDLFIAEINEFVQLYRFDDCRLHVVRGNQAVTFDVPSTEWLERYTEVLRSRENRHYQETLRASGYKLDVRSDGDAVEMMVYDISSASIMPLELSRDEAIEVHDALLNCLLMPFLDQGGRLDQLGDVNRFRL